MNDRQTKTIRDRLSELIIDSTYNVSLDTNLEARFKVVPVALSQSTDDPTSASGSPRTIQFQCFFKLFHNIFSSPFPWKFEYTISVNTLFTKSALVSSLSPPRPPAIWISWSVFACYHTQEQRQTFSKSGLLLDLFKESHAIDKTLGAR